MATLKLPAGHSEKETSGAIPQYLAERSTLSASTIEGRSQMKVRLLAFASVLVALFQTAGANFRW